MMSLHSSRWLFATLLLMVCGPVYASARVTVKTTEPVQVSLDGVVVPTSPGSIRSTIPHVTAGMHTVGVNDLSGQPLHAEVLQIPDSAEVVIQWTRGAPFVVSGASVAGTGTGVDYSQDTPSGVATSNYAAYSSQGTLGRPSGARPSDLLSGNRSVARGSGAVGDAVVSGSPTRMVTAATVGGVRSLTYGAKAGTNFGSGPTEFRQTIKKPNVLYGQVVFIKRSGPAVRIYDDGMLVADLAAGEDMVKSSLEVGRRKLEIRGAADHALWYQGDLMLDQSHTVQLAFDDGMAPKPQVRPWVWQGY